MQVKIIQTLLSVVQAQWHVAQTLLTVVQMWVTYIQTQVKCFF